MFNLGQILVDQPQYPSDDVLIEKEEELFMKEIVGPVSEGDALLILTLILSIVLVVLK